MWSGLRRTPRPVYLGRGAFEGRGLPDSPSAVSPLLGASAAFVTDCGLELQGYSPLLV